ncbi:MAG: four helix bundle protein [Syntrophaceae bacterium]|jgi:hypothetical protein|nr:four helix bundle protein [Syntrophaceae bacterium]
MPILCGLSTLKIGLGEKPWLRPQGSVLFGLWTAKALRPLSNIAEGFERGGDRQFLQFLAMAMGSTGEVRSQLYVALYAGYLSQSEFDEIFTLAAETSRLIGGLMRYLKNAEPNGSKSPRRQERG